MTPPRIAVSGAGGLIGRALFAAAPTLTAIEGDVRDAATFEHDFDILIHLASALPARFEVDLPDAFSVNVFGVERALAACRRQGAALILPSTCGVYAPDQPGPLAEDAAIGPVHAYGWSKWVAERFCEDHHRQFATPVTVLRLFNVYGPGQSEAMLTGYLAACARRGAAMTLNNPDSRRDFIHVDDVARAMLAAAAPRSGFAVFNIGSGRAHGVGEVAARLRALAGGAVEISQTGRNDDAVTTIHADIAKARRVLGWRPAITLDAGLRTLVAEDQSSA